MNVSLQTAYMAQSLITNNGTTNVKNNNNKNNINGTFQ